MRTFAILDNPVWRGHYCPRNAYSKVNQAGNFALFVLLGATLTPCAAAQRPAAPASRATHSSNSLRGNLARAHNRRVSPYVSPYTSLPFPFFGDSFDPSDIYSTGYPVASQPPPFLLQAARDMAGPVADSMGPGISPFNRRESPSSQPLMIELQNGRYVRISSTAADGHALPLIPASASPPQDLPSAVLIFRDGHREEVRDYAIADGILYARGDYYTDGYWNKKIALSGLDVAETLRSNTTRNVKFVLPSSPNEVITRP
jgi:hypothetical protein